MTYRLAASATLVLAALACERANTVHLEPGARTDSLVFHAYQSPDSIDGGQHLSRLTVLQCDSTGWLRQTVWELQHYQGGGRQRPESPVRFRYGADSVPGWRITHRAAPLHLGCYGVTVEGSAMGGLTRFLVRGDGTIEELGGLTANETEARLRDEHAASVAR